MPQTSFPQFHAAGLSLKGAFPPPCRAHTAHLRSALRAPPALPALPQPLPVLVRGILCVLHQTPNQTTNESLINQGATCFGYQGDCQVQIQPEIAMSSSLEQRRCLSRSSRMEREPAPGMLSAPPTFGCRVSCFAKQILPCK